MKKSLHRKVLFEKTPIRVRIKRNIDYDGWWCQDYVGQILKVRETTYEELWFDFRYDIKRHEVENLYLIVGDECTNWVVPKHFVKQY